MSHPLFPDEKAGKIVREARQKTEGLEYKIFKLRERGTHELNMGKSKTMNARVKTQIKDWQKEISETKNEAKKEIDYLPLTSKEKQNYKDLIDGKTDKEKAEQKGFFEKDKGSFSNEFNRSAEPNDLGSFIVQKNDLPQHSKFIPKDKADKDER